MEEDRGVQEVYSFNNLVQWLCMRTNIPLPQLREEKWRYTGGFKKFIHSIILFSSVTDEYHLVSIINGEMRIYRDVQEVYPFNNFASTYFTEAGI